MYFPTLISSSAIFILITGNDLYEKKIFLLFLFSSYPLRKTATLLVCLLSTTDKSLYLLQKC